MKILLKIKDEINNEVIEKLNNIGLRVENVLQSLDIIIVDGEKNISKLEDLNIIEHIELDEQYQLEKFEIKILPDLKIQTLHKNDHHGSNIKVAMIDSGINVDGISLEGNITFTNIDPYDSGCNGRLHGTYVAHIIKKIAPWCKLYGLKVVNSDGEIWKRAILMALDWCCKNNISVINMSLSKRDACKPNCMVCGSLKKVRESNAIAIVAMGNYGREGEGIFGCPATSPDAITVGAVNEFKQIADYSSKGLRNSNKPDILAPGWVQLEGDKPITGTSFASPFVTGTVTSLINEYDIEYTIRVMKETAEDLGLLPHWQGSGLIDIKKMMGVLKDEKNINTSN